MRVVLMRADDARRPECDENAPPYCKSMCKSMCRYKAFVHHDGNERPLQLFISDSVRARDQTDQWKRIAHRAEFIRRPPFWRIHYSTFPLLFFSFLFLGLLLINLLLTLLSSGSAGPRLNNCNANQMGLNLIRLAQCHLIRSNTCSFVFDDFNLERNVTE